MANNEKKFIMKFAASLDASFGKTLGKMNAEMDKLKNVEKNIKGFEKASSLTKKYASSLKEVTTKYTDVTKKVKDFGEVTDKNRKKYDALIAQQSKLKVRMGMYNSEMMKSAANTKAKAQELHKLGLKTSNYNSQLKQVEATMKRMRGEKYGMSLAQDHVGNLKANVGKGIKSVGRVAGTATVAGGVAAGTFAYSSAKSYINFEKQMKKVKAISGATDEEYKKLEATAIRLGATTSFTAEEAASGMEKFALAGFKTNEIISVMPNVLSLTAASGEDLAMVADMISDNMIPFKLGVKDTGRFADILANTMSRTNVSVRMVGETLKYVGSSSGTLGISIEETTAAIGLMGDQAIKSGMAGTSLASAFSRLSNSDVQKKLKKVGITVKDSKGNFLGLANVVQQFQKKTAKMGNVDKNAFLMKIFGEQGFKAFSTLITAQKEFNGETLTGVDALRALTNENKNSAGKAKEMQNTMLEGAQGLMTLMQSAWDGLKIISGKLVLNKELLGWLENVTKYIAELAAVLGGELTSDPINVFFQNIISIIKEFKTNFISAIQPISDALSGMFPDDIDKVKVFRAILTGIIDNLRALAPALAIVVKLIGFFIKVILVIGPDNLMFIATIWLGLMKIIPLILGFVKAVKTAGVVIGWLKGVLAALGGPVTLIITALMFMAYYLAKNGGLWANLKEIAMSVIFAIVASLKMLGTVLVTPFVYVLSIIEGIREGINNWDSNLTIGENLLNIFNTVIEKIKKNFFGLFTWIKDDFSKIWDSIKNIPFVKKLFGSESTVELANKTLRATEGLEKTDRGIDEVIKGDIATVGGESLESRKGTLLNSLVETKNISNSTTNVNSKNSSSQGYSIQIAPQIIIQGNATNETVKDTSKAIADEVRKVLKELGINEKRVSFS